MKEIRCDCCNKRLTYDECYAVPAGSQTRVKGLDRLAEWIHLMPGRVSRIVCLDDYDDYLDIVANRLATQDKVALSDIPASLKMKAYQTAKKRAKAYINGDISGSVVGRFSPWSEKAGIWYFPTVAGWVLVSFGVLFGLATVGAFFNEPPAMKMELPGAVLGFALFVVPSILIGGYLLRKAKGPR